MLLDLVTLKYMLTYASRPIYFFGKVALAMIFLASGSAIGAFVFKFALSFSIFRWGPLLILAALFGIITVQTMMTGVLAEILMRIYHESQNKPVYIIKEILQIKPKAKPKSNGIAKKNELIPCYDPTIFL